MPTFSKLNAQRKYTELIEESSGKWPNWDPARSIRAGDFGTINKKTGELMVEGNIYSHGDIAPIANLHPPIQEAEVDHYQIQSHEVRGSDVEAHTGMDTASAQGVIFRSRWQFKKKRGAILLMHRPRMTWVPDTFFSASYHLPILKGKCVVYQVWNCPGFYMYLSNRSNEQVTVSLRSNVTTPTSSSGVISSPSLAVSWFAESSAGVRQHAYRTDPVYTPLFCLRSIQKP